MRNHLVGLTTSHCLCMPSCPSESGRSGGWSGRRGYGRGRSTQAVAGELAVICFPTPGSIESPVNVTIQYNALLYDL